MTDTPRPTSAGAAATTAPASDPDSLHNLYRMSRTAGLGSGDYVAINNTAILALILGLASVMSLLYPTLLLVALAAVVCGVVALIQVRSSNGTQTGRGFAALGIALGLGLGGLGVGKIAMAAVERRSDEREIGQVVKRFNDFIKAGQYAQAYQALFSDGFKKDISEAEFTARWEAFLARLGEVQSIEWSERAFIDVTPDTDLKRAVAQTRLKFAKMGEPATVGTRYVYADGEWMIDSIGDLFEKPRGAGQPAAPAPGFDPSVPQAPDFGPSGPPAPLTPTTPPPSPGA